MIHLDCDDLFDTWRRQARWLLSHEVDPSLVSWASEGVTDLFGSDEGLPATPGPFQARIPRLLLDTLERAARYRGDQRWSLLYEVLWRVSHGDRTAMMAGDTLGSELQRRIKQVQREAHHLRAFVRFVALPTDEGPGPQYVAWHEPAHDILHRASEHFIGRMGRHRWLIATPVDGVYFDGEQLIYQRQCPVEWQQMAQDIDDPHGDLWLTYYSHIFNPARLNPKVMQGHLPSRFWKNLPEGALIQGLITQARTGKQQDGQASGIKRRVGKRIASPGSEGEQGKGM